MLVDLSAALRKHSFVLLLMENIVMLRLHMSNPIDTSLSDNHLHFLSRSSAVIVDLWSKSIKQSLMNTNEPLSSCFCSLCLAWHGVKKCNTNIFRLLFSRSRGFSSFILSGNSRNKIKDLRSRTLSSLARIKHLSAHPHTACQRCWEKNLFKEWSRRAASDLLPLCWACGC